MHRKMPGMGAILLGVAVTAAVLIGGCNRLQEPVTPTSTLTSAPAASPFVTASEGKFWLEGEAYTFVGTNFWQGMNLGMDGEGGDRERLRAELDRLQQLGVTNLRIMASSEGPDTEPYRMRPALMTAPGEYNPGVLDGLDYLLAKLGEHGMKAVMVLTNYWHWSGGMAQYVSWQDGTAIPYPGDWGAFMDYSAQFYDCSECRAWYRGHIEMLVNHTNPYTGVSYRDDPTIFSWELANEPRRYPLEWINETAAYIKSLDANHMVTTGSEGSPPWEDQDFRDTHAGADIDYTTIHIWPQNWGWYHPADPGSYAEAEADALEYLQAYADLSAALGKPLVLEEFGLARDFEPLNDIYDPAAPTTNRDRFYRAMFAAVYASASRGGALAGDNFWAWGGAARPGDLWIGDPPHEEAGWYSVYDIDISTLEIIAAHTEEMRLP